MGLTYTQPKTLARNVDPEPFRQLDRVIHEKGRLAIMSLLAGSTHLTYTELRDALDMTDGNVSAHLRTLNEAGYVAMTKSFDGGKRVTSFGLTEAGQKAFAIHINLLEQIVRQTRKGS